MSKKIDFCIVGPQRTSTSWIYKQLVGSSLVNLPTKVKETFFFDTKFKKGFSYYFSLFNHFDRSKISGEIGPTYFHSEQAALNIKSHNPDCKIIIVYRDPVDKAISLYQHHLRKGRVGQDFKKASIKIPEIISSGYYDKHTKMWKHHFGEQNVKLVSFDKIRNNPGAFLSEITSFLGIETIYVSTKAAKKMNQSSYPRFPFIARFFAKGATLLRKHDWHSLSEFGKVLGLQSVFTGGTNDRDYSEEEKWLKTKFSEADFLNFSDS